MTEAKQSRLFTPASELQPRARPSREQDGLCDMCGGREAGTMRTLELFCGTKSFSKVAAARGHETFTVDNDPRHEPDLCVDIMDPVLDAPFAPEPRAFRESVPVAVMDPEPKPWSWPVETFDGRAATLARDNPESEHYRRPEVQEDVRAWLLRTLSQLSDDAEARGFRVTVTAEWPALRADIVIEQGARA